MSNSISGVSLEHSTSTSSNLSASLSTPALVHADLRNDSIVCHPPLQDDIPDGYH